VITGITCEACGAALDIPADAELLQSQVCPSCGSSALFVAITASDSLRVDAREFLVLKQGRMRKKNRWLPEREVYRGDSLHRNTGRWSILERTIDRLVDRYTEHIWNRETGERIRDVDEPLSKHGSRGSARRALTDRPTPEELAGIDRGLRDAAEGRFAAEQKVEEVLAKLG
jgi:hypothetical protein